MAMSSTHVIFSDRNKYANKAEVNTEALNTTKKMPSGIYLGALTKQRNANVPHKHLRTTTDLKFRGMDEKNALLL